MSLPDKSPATSHCWRPDSLAASVAVLLAVTIVQRGVGFGRGVLFCRWLSPDELGNWEMAYSFLLMAAPLVVLGLPGSFGRYLERYRQRGQLRTFLRRASIWTTTLTVAAAGLIVIAAPQFSTLIFGRPDERTRVVLIAVCLAMVILHHFPEALFAALRKYRIVSGMHFCQSILFAVVSLTLLWRWQSSAESIIVGYGVACFVSAAGTLLWTARGISEVAVPDVAVPHAHFWPPLVRFAVWVWATNLLCHLFAVVDRYMLVHWSGLENQEALALVGHYHASRVIPLLFISVADLLSGVVMPYMSHDWEAGGRQRVSDRLNLVLKLAALVMFGASVCVLWAAPLMFQFAFEGRYDEGLAVLPGTITYCVWYGLLLIAQNYIWCAERTKIGTLPYAVGLVTNIVLNFLLIPAWDLHGAVAATMLSTAISVAVLYAINRCAGMELQPGVLWLTAAPAALCGGAWFGTLVLAFTLVALPVSKSLITHQERALLRNFYRQNLAVWQAYWSRRVNPRHAAEAR